MCSIYIHECFLNRKFTVHRTKGRFNGVWADMALEQTYNFEGKTALFKGLTQNSDAIDKYIRILPIMTAVSQKVNEMAHFNKSQNSRHIDSRNEAKLQN